MALRVEVAALVACAVIGVWSCSPRRTMAPEPRPAAAANTAAPVANPSPSGEPAAAKPAVSSIAFEVQVRPILATSCAPCHNPGGKMYDRLPFDDPKTVRSNADGIRKRLKGENLETLDAWLAAGD